MCVDEGAVPLLLPGTIIPELASGVVDEVVPADAEVLAAACRFVVLLVGVDARLMRLLSKFV